ncbi:MAG: hypothetical protein Q9191_003431 [Dirinaria sp. TL-2023a]
MVSPSKSRRKHDPRDDFDYQDWQPSAYPTFCIECPPISPVAAENDDPEANEQGMKRLVTNIFEKMIQGTRARYPDEQDHPNGVLAPPDRGLSVSAKGKRGRPPRLYDESAANLYARSIDETTLYRIMLHWGKKDADTQHLVLNADEASKDRKIDSQNSVIWQHSNLEGIKLDTMELLVREMRKRSSGLQGSEIGLTGHLLKKLKTSYEHAFVGGSFLTPTAVRYDMIDSSRYGVDKCYIFLNFPYFTVKKAQQRFGFDKGDPRHPTRTILQSRYRLNKTTEKDKSQCIRMLDAGALKSCIEAPTADTTKLTRKPIDELVYVPQMWALTMGQGHIVTTGPISGQALQGSTIAVREHVTADVSNRCVLVRISFKNRGMHEEVTYPREQCASWFSLLSKHQQIRNALKPGEEQAAPKDYPLYIGDYILEAQTWASVQRSADGEILELWMETPKQSKTAAKHTENGSGLEEGQVIETIDDLWSEPGPTSRIATPRFKALDPVPVVQSFLAWRVVDDFNVVNQQPALTRTKHFLNVIYGSLTAICVKKETNVRGQITVHSRSLGSEPSNDQKICICGSGRKDAGDLGYNKLQPESESCIEQEFLSESAKLFTYFIPQEYEEASKPVQLFWGSIRELRQRRPLYLSSLLNLVEEINGQAEKLHLGVHYEQRTGQLGQYHDANSDKAILFASMVDALGAIFNMLVEAVRVARNGDCNGQMGELRPGNQIKEYGNDACMLLEMARGQLIAATIERAPGENLGPIVTPAAILIVTMERLARGVFGTGSVDVINILEECLEKLALRVEKHSSRRLLQKLNAFEEEVSIVNEVLRQQETVLLKLRKCLDPMGFKKPTTARKMRFEVEKQRIERISGHIRDQSVHCKELQERAKILTVQNVQLVDTLADDNSRAIFVFTFITVVFLPLSFVVGFFGMNLAGISNSSTGVSHFWYVALPFTVGVLILCAFFVTWGESIWFAIINLPRIWKRLFLGKEKSKEL